MWNAKSSSRAAGLAALALLTTSPSLTAQTTSPDELTALREQIRLLDQKLKSLERNLELKDETAAAEAAKQPRLTVSDGRVEIASADGKNSLRLRGLVQADSRCYLDDADAANDTFVLRRARLIFEGRFSDIFDYVVQPEFAGSSVSILDANVNARIAPAFNVRVGRFKTPVGLEQLQSDASAFFNERSIVTNLTPNRDVGVEFHGTFLDKALGYQFAVLNGVPDAANSAAGANDFDSDKSVALRLFATPWIADKDSALQSLGFGIAVGSGNYDTAAGRASGYRTDGQQTFFSYAGTTVADGRGLTVSPQAYYYHGPLGLLAEYVASSIELTNGANSREITNTGFNLSAGYVLTGEDASYAGVKPKTVFNPAAGTWGAFEVVARFAQVDIDDDVFAGASALAGLNNATQTTSYGLGLNWYLSRTVRANLNLFHNTFDLPAGAAPAAGSVLSDDETALITRVQVSF